MCIFCKIVNGQLPSVTRWHHEHWIAIDDIHPKAKTHILLISKLHINSLADAANGDRVILESALPVVQAVAHDLGIVEAGYKVVINTGRGAGQVVDHLHIHVLSGEIQADI